MLLAQKDHLVDSLSFYLNHGLFVEFRAFLFSNEELKESIGKYCVRMVIL